MIGIPCTILVALPSIVTLILGLLGIFVFPSIYKSIVYSILVLTHDDYEGTLGLSTQMFSKPPMINQMKFYFFNITNMDEIIYEGSQARVNEIGPYTYMESEDKRYLQFTEDGDQVFYENYKKWIYRSDLSCVNCDYNDIVTLPNAPQVGTSTALFDPLFHVTPTAKKIIAAALLLLGENAINSPSMGAVLFDGYDDALLSAAHSGIVTLISNIWNGGVNIIPIPVPDMHTMAYFNGYNNSRDESYWIHTGMNDIYKLGDIINWANESLLPSEWYPTETARMINGSDTGSFGKVGLSENDVLPMFHSYMCRSFNAVYQGKRDVEGVPSYTYGVMEDEWDTSLDKNKGFRYRNVEGVNYYPQWPNCPKWNHSNCKATPNDPIDCFTDLCNDCCNKGKVGDTFAVPPGFYPMVCYPGRRESSPFAILWSTPHFLYSPSTVVDSVVGIHPELSLHQPMVYDHEPMSGLITQVAYRAQINIPFFSNEFVMHNSHLPNAIIPIFYESSETMMTDYAYSLYRIGFVYAPIGLFWMSIAFIILSIGLSIVGCALMVKRIRLLNAQKDMFTDM
uniref:Scav-6 n=1 Tax=Pristionchus pacificus TaxID=54126 RepID=A0A8R1UVF7_PRIPA